MSNVPLRAFVMVRSLAGEWEVFVHRDLGGITSQAKAAFDKPGSTVVCHVGFTRPTSVEVDEASKSWPGKVLLTGAAKYSLPVVFGASRFPVSTLNGVNLFLGLNGWGYEVEDPSTEAAEDPIQTQPVEFEGWLAQFIDQNDAASAVLAAAGIANDVQYLRKEGSLEPAMRRELGQFRYYQNVDRKSDDPCEMARASPPWLLNRDLESLDISVRANNAFKVARIRTVKELGEWTPTRLMTLANFGRKSVQDAVYAIRSALEEGPVGVFNGRDVSSSGRLLEDVKRTLWAFSDRERDIVSRRLGFERPEETLQEVADGYNITRERIRQIEAKVSARWIKESYWDDVLEARLIKMLMSARAPLPVAGIEGVDEWFEGVGQSTIFFKNLVQLVCREKVNVLEIGGVDYISFLTLAAWERTVEAAGNMLSSAVGRDWSEAYAKGVVENLLPEGSRVFADLLWSVAARRAQFSTLPDGQKILISFGRGADQIVEAILAESPTPLHYSDIAVRARARTGKEFDVRRAHNAAASVGYLFGRGTFGLARHVPLSEEALAKICEDVEELVLAEVPGKQWHCSELLRALAERGGGEYSGLTKYILDYSLRSSKVLTCLHRLTWTRKESGETEQARIDIYQAMVSILKAAGGPLSRTDLISRLGAIRGVNETFVIASFHPLIRVGGGMWGLNDRDVGITLGEQGILVDRLVALLIERQHGLFPEEIESALPLEGLPIEILLTVAQQNGLVRVSTSRCAYLGCWEGTRRVTIGKALEQILNYPNVALSIDEILQRVVEKTGRKYSRTQVSGALQAADATYDEVARTWRSGVPEQDVDEFQDIDEPQAAV